MQAIVLARRDFREYDQMITLFTGELGKLELLARGSKKILSKNSCALEPASVITFDHAVGRETQHLTFATVENSFFQIRIDFKKNYAAVIALNLVNKLTKEGDVDQRIFQLLLDYLNSLRFIQSFEPIFHIDMFVVKLMTLIGLSPSVSTHTELRNFIIHETGINIPDWEKMSFV